VDGNGTIRVNGGQGSFSVNLQKVGSSAPTGTFGYSDTAAHLTLTNVNVTSLTVTGNQAQIKGTAKTSSSSTVNFTANITDNGNPGTGHDTFGITLSSGYSASGVLISGNANVH
jgi:hypothetical protein